MPDLPLTMPKMSMTMEEGTMVSWLKEVGDSVRAGEPICEVATDKVDMEVESPFDGTLAQILARPDDVLPVGATIALITTEADDLLGGLFDTPAPEQPASALPSDLRASSQDLPSPGNSWIPAVPAARKLAAQAGISLAAIPPTGPWGTVRLTDIETIVNQRKPTPTSTEPPPPARSVAPDDPLAARRRRSRMHVAKVMSVSAAVPQFTAFVDLNLSKLAPVRKTLFGGASWTALLLRAQAMALAEHPHLNAVWTESGVEPQPHIGVALAVDSPSGLMAPVLIDPHAKPLAELVAEIAELVQFTRVGTLPVSRVSGGTTVFSNLGSFGVHSFGALLTPPHATALSAGAVAPAMVMTGEDTFGPRLTCRVGLSVDHRVADGADAARWLATLSSIVGNPDRFN